jgi:hypothetical protein
VEGRPDLSSIEEEPEVQLPHVPVIVAEGVCVLLEQQVLQHTTLGHQPEQVEVAAEEHV